MPIRPELLVRGADGRPLPPPDLIARIQRYAPGISLFYTNAAWAVVEIWREDDARRQWIREGQMQPEFAFDIIGYLPVTASLDEAPALIERELRQYKVADFTALRESVRRWNDEPNTGQDALTKNAVLSAVSDDLDRSNAVSPGISTPVTLELASGANGQESMAQRMARARAAKATKREGAA